MPDSAFRKRFRSSYDSSPSPTLRARKRYRDDESRGLDDEGRGLESDGLGLGEEEVVLEGQQQGALVVRTTVSTTLGLGYGSLRRQELALEEDHI
nr:hypothetical protein [Tanacetum cinerariifolium]